MNSEGILKIDVEAGYFQEFIDIYRYSSKKSNEDLPFEGVGEFDGDVSLIVYRKRT